MILTELLRETSVRLSKSRSHESFFRYKHSYSWINSRICRWTRRRRWRRKEFEIRRGFLDLGLSLDFDSRSIPLRHSHSRPHYSVKEVISCCILSQKNTSQLQHTRNTTFSFFRFCCISQISLISVSFLYIRSPPRSHVTPRYSPITYQLSPLTSHTSLRISLVSF